jgi:hypothetical protein
LATAQADLETGKTALNRVDILVGFRNQASQNQMNI